MEPSVESGSKPNTYLSHLILFALSIVNNSKFRTHHTSLLKENARRQKTLVCEKFDHLYSVLEAKKREMSQKVTAEQEEKVNYIHGLTRKYGDHLEESCKIVEMGIQTMEEPEIALFLQVGLKNKLPTVSEWLQFCFTFELFFFPSSFPLEHKAAT